jgi:hypothetical protein
MNMNPNLKPPVGLELVVEYTPVAVCMTLPKLW